MIGKTLGDFQTDSVQFKPKLGAKPKVRVTYPVPHSQLAVFKKRRQTGWCRSTVELTQSQNGILKTSLCINRTKQYAFKIILGGKNSDYS